jgi:hypothetical protein
VTVENIDRGLSPSLQVSEIVEAGIETGEPSRGAIISAHRESSTGLGVDQRSSKPAAAHGFTFP